MRDRAAQRDGVPTGVFDRERVREKVRECVRESRIDRADVSCSQSAARHTRNRQLVANYMLRSSLNDVELSVSLTAWFRLRWTQYNPEQDSRLTPCQTLIYRQYGRQLLTLHARPVDCVSVGASLKGEQWRLVRFQLVGRKVEMV